MLMSITRGKVRHLESFSSLEILSCSLRWRKRMRREKLNHIQIQFLFSLVCYFFAILLNVDQCMFDLLGFISTLSNRDLTSVFIFSNISFRFSIYFCHLLTFCAK